MLPNNLPRPSTNSSYYLVQFPLRFYNLPRNRTQGTLLTYSVLGRPEIIAKKCQKVSMSQAAVAVKKTSDLIMTQRTLSHLLKRTTLTTKILKHLKVANVKYKEKHCTCKEKDENSCCFEKNSYHQEKYSQESSS